MLRSQRELNILSRSVEMKTSDVLRSVMDVFCEILTEAR